MNEQNKKNNKSLMTGWLVIVVALSVAYIGEYLKGTRSLGYVAVFLLCTIVPNLYCLAYYRRNPDSATLPDRAVSCFFVMYIFSVLTGNTGMVFCYILPLLSFLVLFHRPKLTLWTGVAAVLVNGLYVVLRVLRGQITLENSRDAEIQFVVVILCFGSCYVATLMYNRANLQNVDFVGELQEKDDQSQQMTFQTIMTIVNTIDAKDEYTKGHSQRVSEYSAALAAELGKNSKEVEQIRYIALLHDIGKIGVPDAILNKAGKLNTEEFDLMKLHTVLGGDILKDINAVEGLAVGAKYHHERYDGNGYPEGLRGEQIPFVARVICVADAYDAMTSNRVYRRRLSDEAVEQEIRRCSGSQFDPGMAMAFTKMLREGRLKPISTDQYISPALSENMAYQVLQKVLENTGVYGRGESDEDMLTSVYSKSYGERLLGDYLKYGEGTMIAVDIDALRNINGQYGYAHGDLYLNVLANVLKEIADNQILYRSGGDEFMCFLCGVTDAAIVEEKVEKINRKLEEQRQQDPLLAALSVSIGVFTVHREGQQLKDVLTKAERSLYFAKQRDSAGNYCIYQNLQRELQQNLSKADLDNLVKTIQNQGEYANAYQVNYPEFSKMVNYIKKVVERNEQQMQIIMFTVLPADEEAATVEKRLEAMDMLKLAVVNSLRSVDVTMQFSSSQRIAILMNMEEKDIQIAAQRIISAFYKGNKDRNFSIHYDVADLNV